MLIEMLTYNEDVLQHGLQCAAVAKRHKESPQFVAAALLHNIGHMVDEEGAHEVVGAQLLADLGFSDFTVSLVRNHVNSKRYSAITNPATLCHMTASSLRNLFSHQGGPMTEQQCEAFKKEPYFEEHLRLRAIIDCDKLEPITATIEDYRDLLTTASL